jgi:hypothetical protein
MQCADGYCETTYVSCSSDPECVGSGLCNLTYGRCEYYCVALRNDGAICDSYFQCDSGACVDGFCRTLPLVDGSPCTSPGQCESGFCGYDEPRVCESLPLASGKRCTSPEQCESGVCFDAACVAGLTDGQPCDDPFQPPCARDLFCDATEDNPLCTPVLEAGQECEASYQCRQSCTLRFGRYVCDATPAQDAAVCDGP